MDRMDQYAAGAGFNKFSPVSTLVCPGRHFVVRALFPRTTVHPIYLSELSPPCDTLEPPFVQRATLLTLHLQQKTKTHKHP